jgi:hypothetical protein
MKKLTLNVEMLRVESFAVASQTAVAEYLTVVAEATRPLICDPATVPPRCA